MQGMQLHSPAGRRSRSRGRGTSAQAVRRLDRLHMVYDWRRTCSRMPSQSARCCALSVLLRALSTKAAPPMPTRRRVLRGRARSTPPTLRPHGDAAVRHSRAGGAQETMVFLDRPPFSRDSLHRRLVGLLASRPDPYAKGPRGRLVVSVPAISRATATAQLARERRIVENAIDCWHRTRR